MIAQSGKTPDEICALSGVPKVVLDFALERGLTSFSMVMKLCNVLGIHAYGQLVEGETPEFYVRRRESGKD
ncbi:MAG: hypothetical protein IJG33_13385 [Selenomonadaceae bacterium]|nr:hypothetical protein [Selenomonadaceae bacterium]